MRGARLLSLVSFLGGRVSPNAPLYTMRLLDMPSVFCQRRHIFCGLPASNEGSSSWNNSSLPFPRLSSYSSSCRTRLSPYLVLTTTSLAGQNPRQYTLSFEGIQMVQSPTPSTSLWRNLGRKI